MTPVQKSDDKKRPSTHGNGASATSENEKGAGLWMFFPLVTVVVGIVLGLLINAEPGKQADSEPPAVKKAGALYQALENAYSPHKPLSSSLHEVDVDGPYCGAQAFLSPTHVVSGFHLACLQPQEDSGDVSFTLFLHGQSEGNDTLTLSSSANTKDDADFHAELAQRLKLDEPGPDPPNKFPWAMYTPDGQRKIASLEDAIASRLVFIFKGGNFIWPGVEIGHVQTVRGLQTLDSIEMKTLSMQPLVFEAKDFLLDDECRYIREKADPHMKPSPVSLMDHDKGKSDTNWRTSTTYFMPSTNDPTLQGIDQRVEEFTRVPRSHQEHVQVLKYDEGQRYSAHHDYFNPKLYQKDPRTLRNMDGGRKNRMITVFWYLSDVEEGGETIFPRFGGRKGAVDFSDCTRGLKVKPAAGKVAMFYSLRPDGQFDDFSLHGACPVTTGRKWAANKWIWSAPVHFGR